MRYAHTSMFIFHSATKFINDNLCNKTCNHLDQFHHGRSVKKISPWQKNIGLSFAGRTPCPARVQKKIQRINCFLMTAPPTVRKNAKSLRFVLLEIYQLHPESSISCHEAAYPDDEHTKRIRSNNGISDILPCL
jgi:hypothetical protein